QYMEHVFTGFSGVITDSATGKPIRGRVRLLNYDFDNSFVFSRPDDGSYYRLLKPGNYNVLFNSTGYQYKLVPVSVADNALTSVDVKLSTDFTLALYPNPFTDHFFLNIPYSGYTLYVFVIDMLGRKVKVVSKFIRNSGQQQIDIGGLSSGYYIIHVVYNDQSWSLSGIRRNP
ncbi:MAG TPA: T9SS type A sorting domain-containing protein, partial [Bacteroidales bacterium]|nr:T9SS type A sorting domain-containing protein [Bacteroidales bacterium]